MNTAYETIKLAGYIPGSRFEADIVGLDTSSTKCPKKANTLSRTEIWSFSIEKTQREKRVGPSRRKKTTQGAAKKNKLPAPSQKRKTQEIAASVSTVQSTADVLDLDLKCSPTMLTTPPSFGEGIQTECEQLKMHITKHHNSIVTAKIEAADNCPFGITPRPESESTTFAEIKDEVVKSEPLDECCPSLTYHSGGDRTSSEVPVADSGNFGPYTLFRPRPSPMQLQSWSGRDPDPPRPWPWPEFKEPPVTPVTRSDWPSIFGESCDEDIIQHVTAELQNDDRKRAHKRKAFVAPSESRLPRLKKCKLKR